MALQPSIGLKSLDQVQRIKIDSCMTCLKGSNNFMRRFKEAQGRKHAHFLAKGM